MKQRGFTLIELCVCVAIVLILAAILFPVFTRTSCGSSRTSSCQSNLKQIGLAFHQYAQDSDERLPSVQGSMLHWGWADALVPYLSTSQPLHCPSETRDLVSTTPIVGGYTDYWMNTLASNRRVSQFPKPSRTLLAGEGSDGRDVTNARYSYHELPPHWLSDQQSPAQRHYGGANYLFIDGHVRRLRPETISVAPPEEAVATFSPR